MPNIDDEMKAAANYTIRIAREKFGQDLDFSEPSLARLEILLTKAGQSLSARAKDETTRNSIFRTANAWGSFLGEYMRLRWGGTWILRGSERILSLGNIEFFPIAFVYQKITSHSQYNVIDYITEAERKISNPAVVKHQPPKISENITQSKRHSTVNPLKNTTTINKKIILFGLVGMVALCFFGVLAITIYSTIRATNEFKTKLNIFLSEAEKLNVMTEQGVTFEEFRAQLIEVKSTYAAIDSWPLSYRKENRSFDLAIQGWDYALDVWNHQIVMLTGNFTNLVMPNYDGIGAYLGNPNVGGGYDTVRLLMSRASIYYEEGKAGIK